MTISSMTKKTKIYIGTLVVRVCMMLILLVFCILYPKRVPQELYDTSFRIDLVSIFWLILMATILARFLPSNRASMGSEKQFASRFTPTRDYVSGLLDKLHFRTEHKIFSHGAAASAIAWCILNGGIYALYFTHVISEVVLVLVAAAYAVSDVVCILFFCPFQQFFMKNRCCTVCRIYNWDFMMICTPLLPIKSFFTWTLCLAAAVLLIRWEIYVHRYPERFSERANQNLTCASCTDKLCQIKRGGHVPCDKAI